MFSPRFRDETEKWNGSLEMDQQEVTRYFPRDGKTEV